MNIVALMMEAISTSETWVNFYQTARRNIPEDSYLHTRRQENLKSNLLGVDQTFGYHNAPFHIGLLSSRKRAERRRKRIGVSIRGMKREGEGRR
jgi:hypothetical protein